MNTIKSISKSSQNICYIFFFKRFVHSSRILKTCQQSIFFPGHFTLQFTEYVLDININIKKYKNFFSYIFVSLIFQARISSRQYQLSK